MNKYPIEVGAVVVSKMGRDEGRTSCCWPTANSERWIT